MAHKEYQGSSSAAALVKESSKQMEKEKQAEMGADAMKKNQTVRDRRKEQSEKGRDERNSDRRKENKTGMDHKDTDLQFFKVFLPEQSRERLQIPSAFLDNLQKEPNNRPVSLRGPSGNTWQVLLTSDSKGMGFTKGWMEFARDHSLSVGQVLLFTYDGHSQFSVEVFCESGVEDKSARDIQPRNEEFVQHEEEEGDADLDAAGMAELSTPPMQGNRTTRKRVTQLSPVEANCTVGKRHSSVQKSQEIRKPQATIDTSKAAQNFINDPPSILDQYSCSTNTLSRSKHITRMGTFMFTKFRQPVIKSQRRAVTEEEKMYTFKRAKEFKSKKPFAVQVMMESNVYVGFFLNIPSELVRESLPRENKKMTLWDPQAMPWEVSYLYHDDKSVAAFSGGWGKFAIANILEKFDVCVFELIKKDNIKVHIYRVVPDLTLPLIYP